MNAETILNATIGVLKERGRHIGDYEQAGKCCVLGAMGYAAGRDERHWAGLQDCYPENLEPIDYTLMEAGRLLVKVIDPHVRVSDLDADQVIWAVSGWNDATQVDSEVFEKLAEAARLAEQAGAR